MDVARVELDVRQEPGYAVAIARGWLSSATVAQLHRQLEKLLRDTGTVLVDISRLLLGWRFAVRVFPTALDAAGGWPCSRLVLFGPDAKLAAALAASRVPRSVPVVRNEAQARAAAQTRPELVRRSLRLPAETTAPRLARAFVGALGTDWSLDRRTVEDAALIATELVANAVVHARSCSVLTAELTADRMGISVRDQTRHRRPRSHPSDGEASSARGLTIIGRVAQDWGVIEHRDSKVVWARLATAVRQV